MVRRAFIAACVLFALYAAAVPASADVWNKTWPVAGQPQVLVNAGDGNIRVEIGDSGNVKAVVTTVGWRIADDEVRVTERQEGNRVVLELRLPQRNFSFRIHSRITIELTVPKAAELDLHTGDGNIETHGLEGPLRCDTGDGNITALGARGNVRLRTGDGNVHTAEMEGSLTVDTGDGNISAEGRFEALDVRTGDGNVHVTAYAGSRLAASWRVRTGDGNITVALPDGIAADLDAHTGDGRVTSDFAVGVSGTPSRTSLRGPMNGGGQPLEIQTGDGDIRVARR